MRTYYLFKIKKTYSILTKNNPYNLYKAIEEMYYLKSNQLDYLALFFYQLKDNFNKSLLDNNIYEKYKNKDNYTKVNDTHLIIDYFTKEKTKLIINPSYIYIKSTKNIPTFLKTINKKENIFVCDFKNKDYFWLEEIL